MMSSTSTPRAARSGAPSASAHSTHAHSAMAASAKAASTPTPSVPTPSAPTPSTPTPSTFTPSSPAPFALEAEQRRAKVASMARLARAYRGWTVAQLNEALGRPLTRLASVSANPKLDLVARLADALEWEIGSVAENIWTPDADVDPGDARWHASFAMLDARAQAEHRAGSCAEMERTARVMREVAGSARERAVAANRLAGAFDGLGRYTRVLECVREGLAEREIGTDIRTMLTVNLANAHYTLWNLQEARSIAEGVLERFAGEAPVARIDRVAEAFGRALRGHARRRMLATAEPGAELDAAAASAVHDLRLAAELYRRLADDYGDAQYEALAHTARGGVIEARVAAGEIAGADAIEIILAELDRFVDLHTEPSPQLVESAGWWAVFGANIAVRMGECRADAGATAAVDPAGRSADRSTPRGRARRGGIGARSSTSPSTGASTSASASTSALGIDRAIAICTNKASEVADHLGHWPMRERAFTLEWLRRSTLGRIAGDDLASWTLDAEDLRILVGAMGRFPFFRQTGWAILERASIAAS